MDVEDVQRRLTGFRNQIPTLYNEDFASSRFQAWYQEVSGILGEVFGPGSVECGAFHSIRFEISPNLDRLTDEQLSKLLAQQDALGRSPPKVDFSRGHYLRERLHEADELLVSAQVSMRNR